MGLVCLLVLLLLACWRNCFHGFRLFVIGLLAVLSVLRCWVSDLWWLVIGVIVGDCCAFNVVFVACLLSAW